MSFIVLSNVEKSFGKTKVLRGLNLSIESRELVAIRGASGSGKSYIARGLAEKYKKMFPDRQVYLISKLLEDSTTIIIFCSIILYRYLTHYKIHH
jgi:ABC-type multidrug transport system ATPase subunit